MGGNHGVVVNNGRDLPSNIEIKDNEFINNFYSSVYTSYTKQVIIEGNRFDTYRTGIYSDNTTDLIISDNRIKITAVQDWHNSGIRLEDNNDTVLIFNNYIRSSGIYKSEGIGMQNSYHIGVHFNSIDITNTDVARESKGIHLNGNNQVEARNNIFNIRSSGYPAYITTGTTGFSLDYNDYYSYDNKIGRFGLNDVYSLEEWQNVTGQDFHSFSENPIYTSTIDLSMNQVLLNNAGTPVPGITHDIDATLRNPLEPDLGAKEYDPCRPDAGINKITSPANPVPQGYSEVKVNLQNQGNSVLNSALINWKVNGELQEPYPWNGTLPVKASIEVTIGTFNFAGGIYTLQAWTTQPNGVNDCNIHNDTSRVDRAGLLCGTYTIGGVNPDFASFTEAVNVLNTAGISCPVVFKVRDGEYFEQVALKDIPGASAQNTITFESESGDSTAVILRYEGPTITLNLKNASYINFRRIGFKGDQLFMADEQSHHISIQHCYFQDGNWQIGILNKSHDIQILNNTFMGGNHGVVVNNGLDLPSNIEIKENEFIIQGTASVYTSYTKQVLIEGNRFDTYRTGIYSDNTFNLTISNNHIKVAAQPDWHNSGIRLEGNNDTVLVYNNHIQTAGVYKSEGIGVQNSYRVGVYFNTVEIANTDVGWESKGIHLNSISQVEVRNNIFKIRSSGYPAYITSGTTGFSLDYNDYFNNLGKVGRFNDIEYFNLSDWGLAVNGDANSKTVNPNFASEDNPLPYQRELNGAGVPVAGILLDINGRIRNDQAPDIGCWEFTVDFGATDLISPTLDCYHTEIDSVTVYLRQFGDIPFIDLKLAYQVNNGPIHYDTIPGSIYNDLLYTFTTTVDMSQDGAYFFKIWLINALDDNINNDTLKAIRYSKPSPQVSSQYDNLCTGKEVVFSGQASIAEPYSIASYEWIFGDGMTSLEQNPVHIYEEAGTYAVIFRAYSNSGCYAAMTNIVDINPDYAPLSLTSDINNEICENDENGKITLTPAGGYPPYSYFLNGQQQDHNVFSGLTAGSYTIRVTDDRGCSLADTLEILPTTLLNPILYVDPLTGFAPMTVHFDLTCDNAASWIWHLDENVTDTTRSPSYTFWEYGDHRVLLEVNSGAPNFCTDTASILIFTDLIVEIDYNDVLTPNGDGTNDYFEVTSFGLKTLNVKIYDRWGKKVYEITEVDGKWDGNTESGKEALDGVYYFYLKALGVDGLDYERQGSITLIRDVINTYPNPVSDKVNLKVGSQLGDNLTIQMFSIDGKERRSVSVARSDIISIDISDLPDGFYILRLTDGAKIIHTKILKVSQ